MLSWSVLKRNKPVFFIRVFFSFQIPLHSAQVAVFGETSLCLGGWIIFFLYFEMSFHPDMFLFLLIWMEAFGMILSTVTIYKK